MIQENKLKLDIIRVTQQNKNANLSEKSFDKVFSNNINTSKKESFRQSSVSPNYRVIGNYDALDD